MASRRYSPIAEHPMYNRMFDVLKAASPILNPHGPPNAYSVNLGDASTLKSLILERQGAQGNPKLEHGFLWRGERGEKTPSLLLVAKERIEAIEKDFARVKQTVTNSGRKPPTQMPAEMTNRLLKAEARFDVIQAEIETLERFLKVFTDAKDSTSNQNVLQHGPRGSSKMKGGILTILDGQKVELDKNGILRIADTRSRYNKMKTCEYFETIAKPWLRANAKLLREHIVKCRAGELDGPKTRAPKAPWPKKPKEAKAA